MEDVAQHKGINFSEIEIWFQERTFIVSDKRSLRARIRDELLNGELFYSLKEAKIIIENWRRHYNLVS